MPLLAPGGGGWGNPLERSADRVLADVAEGLVSAKGALRDYGLVVERGNGAWAATPTAERVAAGSTTLVDRDCGSDGDALTVEVSP